MRAINSAPNWEQNRKRGFTSTPYTAFARHTHSTEFLRVNTCHIQPINAGPQNAAAIILTIPYTNDATIAFSSGPSKADLMSASRGVISYITCARVALSLE